MSLRVAIVADRFPPAWGGGVASAHYHLCRLLESRGHEVKVFTYFDEAAEDSPAIVRRRLPHRAVRLIRRLSNLAFRLADPKADAAYQTQDILLRAWGAFSLSRPLAGFRPDVAVLPDHGAPGLWLRTPPGCRRVMIAHHNPSRFLDLPGMPRLSARDIRLAMAIEDRVLASMDRVVCPSRYMADVFRATHRFDGELVVAPNVVDKAYLDAIPAADPRPALGLPPDAAMVYLPAGGNRFKGADHTPALIQGLAARSGRPVGFYVSGAIPRSLRDALPAGVPILAPGAQANDAVLATARACSFGIYPTLVDNFSMALLEAALIGLPMIATAVGGNPEIVIDGINGHLVPSGAVEAMLERGLDLLDPEKAARLSRATLEDAARRLSVEAVGDRVADALTRFGG